MLFFAAPSCSPLPLAETPPESDQRLPLVDCWVAWKEEDGGLEEEEAQAAKVVNKWWWKENGWWMVERAEVVVEMAKGVWEEWLAGATWEQWEAVQRRAAQGCEIA